MARCNRTSTAFASKTHNQEMALELRRAGLGYRQIGNRLGLSRSHVHRLVTAALVEARGRVSGQVEQLVAEEINRLDGLLGTVWPKARQGDLGAVDRVLKIMERRARLLGLDTPVRVEATGRDGGPIATRNDGIPLDRLTREELEALERIALAAESRPRSGVA